MLTAEQKHEGRREARKLYTVHSCQRCKSESNIERHHIDGNPTNNKWENIEALCLPCHRKEHRRLSEKSCFVCKSMFRPRRQTSAICGHASCISEVRRLASLGLRAV